MLDVFRENHLALYEHVGQIAVALGMLAQQLLGALVLFGDDAAHLLVDDSGSLVAIRFRESVVLPGGVVVAQVGEAFAHAVVHHHGVGLLGDTFQVVGRAGRNVPEE